MSSAGKRNEHSTAPLEAGSGDEAEARGAARVPNIERASCCLPCAEPAVPGARSPTLSATGNEHRPRCVDNRVLSHELGRWRAERCDRAFGGTNGHERALDDGKLNEGGASGGCGAHESDEGLRSVEEGIEAAASATDEVERPICHGVSVSDGQDDQEASTVGGSVSAAAAGNVEKALAGSCGSSCRVGFQGCGREMIQLPRERPLPKRLPQPVDALKEQVGRVGGEGRCALLAEREERMWHAAGAAAQRCAPSNAPAGAIEAPERCHTRRAADAAGLDWLAYRNQVESFAGCSERENALLLRRPRPKAGPRAASERMDASGGSTPVLPQHPKRVHSLPSENTCRQRKESSSSTAARSVEIQLPHRLHSPAAGGEEPELSQGIGYEQSLPCSSRREGEDGRRERE
eukprot:scaffold256432_cov30-Tisochrysis_lutea.AAC.1